MTDTDSTLDSNLIYLLPGRFGPATMFEAPIEGFVPVTAGRTDPQYKPGTVCQVYNNGSGAYGIEGFSELVYLQYNATGAPAMVAKRLAIPYSATVWYQYTNDPDTSGRDHTGCAHAVVNLSVLTDGLFGWFWCGGVCPEQYVTGLGGNYETDGSVDDTLDLNICCAKLSDDGIGFGPAIAATEAAIGMALAAEA